MTVPLVVGMPVYRRGWVLDRWFDSLEAQHPPDGTRLIFAVSPTEPDDGTEKIIAQRAPTAEVLRIDGLPTFSDSEEDRTAPNRYAVLAHIRNKLLRSVAAIGPEHYLSWDSDIILAPGALEAMLAVNVGAVGALVDMGGSVHPGHWSWMDLDGDWAERPPRYELSGARLGFKRHGPLPFFGDNDTLPRECDLPYFYGRPFRAGVIMGVKLMAPAAYRNVRYADHLLGEDVGWAIQCEAMGVERWVCPAARGTHLYRFASAE